MEVSAERLFQYDDEFDLDVQIFPSDDWGSPEMGASGTCGGCPDPSDEGSTCKFSCPHTCGGQCTYQPADPECADME